MIELDSTSSNQISGHILKESSVRIKLLGIGGAGCRIVSRLNISLPSIESVVLNTDKNSLEKSKVGKKIQLGESITRGWGAGGDPEIGKQVALQEKDRLKEVLKDTDLSIIITGLGKGTGTGVSPIVAQLVKEMDSLVWGITILPFFFEGKKRINQAQKGLKNIEKIVDALMVIPNDNLLKKIGENLSLKEGFEKVDKFLEEVILGIGNFFHQLGFLDLDFADVKSLLKKGNRIQVFTGRGKGKDAPQQAVKKAFSFSLYAENFLKKTEAIIINIRGGKDLSLSEIKDTVHLVKDNLSSRGDIIVGVGIDENLTDEIVLNLLISGKEEESDREELELKLFRSNDLEIPTFLRKGEN